MVKPRKLKFELNIRMNESVMYVNFGDPRSRDRESRYKKHKKRVLINALCKPSLRAPSHVTKNFTGQKCVNS